ncbi:hypothetical protein VTK73DRAFT_9428 [Phialemonium thermophilum]|uniref:Glycosyl hydrolase family 13 catalytic domain-containing protein n=1 Tax=Phialemonium thermophilum TaxID=223376 RepID=A0ABR3W2C6_9PEZI
MSRLHQHITDPERVAALRRQYQKKSRDNARTPMQWDASRHAGFTDGDRPWMAVNPNFAAVNAARQLPDPTSVFHCWRSVLATRKKHKDIFVYGDFHLVDEPHEKVFAYSRAAADGGQVAVVVCNFSADVVDWDGLKEEAIGDVLLTTEGRTLEHFQHGKITLQPYEAAALLL